jgi:hypothetical protein
MGGLSSVDSSNCKIGDEDIFLWPVQPLRLWDRWNLVLCDKEVNWCIDGWYTDVDFCSLNENAVDFLC